MSPSSTVHGGQHDTKYGSWLTTFGVLCLNQLVYIPSIYQVRSIYQVQHTSMDQKIGAASTAVPSLSNVMHIFLNIKADLRPVPANIICRRPSSLLTQHLQAYRDAKGSHAFVHHHVLPILLSRHDNAFHFSINNQIMINHSTFILLI